MESEEESFKEVFPLVVALLAAMALVFLVAALVIGGGEDDELYVPSGMTRADVLAQRVEPIGDVNMGGPKLAKAAAADEGEAGGGIPETADGIYNAVCGACHDQGVAGAPKMGNQAAWQDRYDQRGIDTLYDHAINGFKGMPARGGNADLSDEQVRKTVDYMLEESGLSP